MNIKGSQILIIITKITTLQSYTSSLTRVQATMDPYNNNNRSNQLNSNNNAYYSSRGLFSKSSNITKAGRNNRSKQMNPNNRAFHLSRGKINSGACPDSSSFCDNLVYIIFIHLGINFLASLWIYFLAFLLLLWLLCIGVILVYYIKEKLQTSSVLVYISERLNKKYNV